MLILIDGSNLAHRALHASFSDLGYYSHIEAVPYFLKRLAGIVEYQHLLAGVVVAWDRGLPLHRRELYSEYKPDTSPLGEFDAKLFSKINKDPSLEPHRSIKGREDAVSEYHKLITLLSEIVVPKCNCISIRVTNVEADDIIAYCCYYLKDFEKQVISSDRDLLQLVDETTSVYNFSSPNPNSKLYDYDWIEQTYDEPEWFREAFLIEKAILGDTSDNIPGIESVGDTTAKKYTNSIISHRIQGKSLEEAILAVERPTRASKKGFENLKEGTDIVKRNFDLMDLNLPIYKKLSLVYNIQKEFMYFLNHNIDYYDALDELEMLPDFPFNKCYSQIDKIFESNCNYDMKTILERIRDATT